MPSERKGLWAFFPSVWGIPDNDGKACQGELTMSPLLFNKQEHLLHAIPGSGSWGHTSEQGGPGFCPRGADTRGNRRGTEKLTGGAIIQV